MEIRHRRNLAKQDYVKTRVIRHDEHRYLSHTLLRIIQDLTFNCEAEVVKQQLAIKIVNPSFHKP